jgi:hypothetical protein
MQSTDPSSIAIANSLTTHILLNYEQLLWETQTLRHLNPYLIESILLIVPNLMAPLHADCPSKDFEGCNTEAEEPVTSLSL